MTIREKAASILEGYGYQIVKTGKRWVATHPDLITKGSKQKYYLGPSGSVRRGATLTGSLPVKLKGM